MPGSCRSRSGGLDTDEPVGCTRYLDLNWWRGRTEPDEVEIGGTWLGANAQRTPINTEAKYLLLGYAFEQYRGLAGRDLHRCRATNAAATRSSGSARRSKGSSGTTASGTDTDGPTPRHTAVYSVVIERVARGEGRAEARLNRA